MNPEARTWLMLVLRAMQILACSASLSCALTIGPLFLAGITAQVIQVFIALLAFSIEVTRRRIGRPGTTHASLEEQP